MKNFFIVFVVFFVGIVVCEELVSKVFLRGIWEIIVNFCKNFWIKSEKSIVFCGEIIDINFGECLCKSVNSVYLELKESTNFFIEGGCCFI